MKKPKTQQKRNQVRIKGLTFADINECFYLAIMDSASDYNARKAMAIWKKTGEINPSFVYDLDWEHIDPIAIRQNLDCWIESKMGIFPNIEPLKAN